MLEFDTGHLSIDGARVYLTRKEVLLLEHLARRRGETVAFEELFALLHPEMGAFLPRALDVYIVHARRILKSATGGHSFIETVWRKGYRFADVP
jgi:two-component system cell cycle response regulator CtrA